MKKIKLVKAFKDSIAIYPKLFSYWKILIAVHILSFLATEAFSWEQDRVLGSGREELMPIFLIFAGSILVEIVFTTAWVIAVTHAVRSIESKKNFETNVFQDFNAALIEATRSLARVLRWIPVFIVPGLVKFIRLTFVPFIVVDQPAYKRGSIDALNESERLIKTHFWKILFALVLALGLPSLPGLFLEGENISLASRPSLSITWSVFEFFTSLLATVFLFSIYRQLATEPKTNSGD